MQHTQKSSMLKVSAVNLRLDWVHEWQKDIPENFEPNVQLVSAAVGTGLVGMWQSGISLQASGMVTVCCQ